MDVQLPDTLHDAFLFIGRIARLATPYIERQVGPLSNMPPFFAMDNSELSPEDLKGFNELVSFLVWCAIQELEINQH